MCEHCQKEATIEEIKHEMHVGEMTFQRIEGKVDVLIASDQDRANTMAALNKRLFIDNGSPSFQTKQDRHDQLLRGLLWAAGITAATSISTLIGLIVRAILHANGGG